MTINILHIDDDREDLKKFKERFSKVCIDEEKIQYDTLYSNEFLKQPDILDQYAPDSILVDFKFEKGDPGESILPFDGLTFTTHLREKYPDIPIFLFTKPQWVNDVDFANFNKIIGTTDEYILKKEYIKKRDIENGIIFSIIQGYKQLNSIETKEVQNLFELLRAPELIFSDLSTIFPKDSLNETGQWSVFPVAKWIRKVLMHYPGLLYNEIEAATFLGISVNEFKTPDIQEFFKSAQYCGPFYKEKDLWWKSELMTLSDKLMTEEEIFLPFNIGFSRMWNRVFDNELDPALCEDSGEYPADCVCYILRVPVMMKYSLKYCPDDRPQIMDDARVSFKAISLSDKINPEFFESDANEIYERLLKGEYAYKRS